MQTPPYNLRFRTFSKFNNQLADCVPSISQQLTPAALITKYKHIFKIISVPILFTNSFGEFIDPPNIMEPPQSASLQPEKMVYAFSMYLSHPPEKPNYQKYLKPWKLLSYGTPVSGRKDKFKVYLDVHNFKLEEISVKATGKNEITVESKHAEKKDEHGSISRHFLRRLTVPDGHDVSKGFGEWCPRGILSIEIPKDECASEEPKKTLLKSLAGLLTKSRETLRSE